MLQPVGYSESQETEPCGTHTTLTGGEAGKCSCELGNENKEDQRRLGGPLLVTMRVTWRGAVTVASDCSRPVSQKHWDELSK